MKFQTRLKELWLEKGVSQLEIAKMLNNIQNGGISLGKGK